MPASHRSFAGHRVLHALILGLTCLAIPASGQDLFDDAPGLFGPTEDAVVEGGNAEGGATPEANPLVDQLMEHARRGNAEFATAVSSLARVGRWKLVDQLLTQLAKQDPDQASLVEMQREIEPAVFLRIRRYPDLSPESKSALTKMAEAATAVYESPDLLRKAIAQLGNDSGDVQAAALRVLLDGGNAAVTELVAAAVTDITPAARDRILQVMLQLGVGGTQALRQLALYGAPNVRTPAITSLARIDRQSNIPSLLTSAFATDATSSESEVAANQLQRIEGQMPGRKTALAYLQIDFEQKLELARLVNNDQQTTTVWSVDSDRTGVTNQSSLLIMKKYRDATDAAARLRRVGIASDQMAHAVLAVDVAYRVLVDPDWGDPDQVDAIWQAHQLNGATIAGALATALDEQDNLATIGLVRLIKSETNAFDRAALLNSNGARPCPLVQAAMSPTPRVRYESALAATRLAGSSAFPGSSYVMRAISEMASLGDRPTAVLVETRPEVVTALENLLSRMGYEVALVGTVRELQRCVAKGGDIRLILSKTELADLPVIEMLDLIRRMDRGRNIPIALFGSAPEGIDRGRWESPAVLIEQPSSAFAFEELMADVNQRRRIEPLSVLDRKHYRDRAHEALTLR